MKITDKEALQALKGGKTLQLDMCTFIKLRDNDSCLIVNEYGTPFVFILHELKNDGWQILE